MSTMPFVDAPLIKNFRVIAGDTFYFSFRLLDDDDQPLDLTGWDGWLEGIAGDTDTEPAISIRVGSGFTLGGATGRITAKALPAVTHDWPDQSITYRLKLKDAAGDVKTFFTGILETLKEITT